MEAHAHHGHHELPTSGRALDALALSATLHCLTGCAIGEVTGMIIGTALGWSDWGTVALAVALAVAGFAAFPANRWLLKRGKGHAAVHETGIHGGPSPRVVGTIAVLAASFGTVVLVAEALGWGRCIAATWEAAAGSSLTSRS